MLCQKCGHINDEGNNFCGKCGISLTDRQNASTGIPELASVVDVNNGTDLLLASAAANGVKKIFFNGGTDNFQLMESVAKFKAMMRPTPDLVMTVHEHTGLCAAVGYFQWTRQPQILVLHTALGTMQPGGAWDEAWRGKAGVVALAGSVGQTTKNELGYATRGGIQFSQEVYHQESMLGSYAKWSYKIERAENASLIMNRAFQMAASEPCGISYLTYPMEVAAAPITKGLLYNPTDFASAVSGEGDSSALKEAARLLVEANNPIALVKGMGRHPESVAHLIALAEKLALPIVSNDKYMNFPRTHWANSDANLNSRDVILLIDNDVPWTNTDPPKTAKIISLDSDPLQARNPMNGLPVHIPITCNSGSALRVLTQMCEEFITVKRRDIFKERKESLQVAKRAADDARIKSIEKAKGEFPLNRLWVSECIRQASDENTVLLWDIGGIGGQADCTKPGHVFQMWGASLGTSWGRGIGIKLAAPEKTVIISGGDGCTLYSEPIACLQLARQYHAPVLYCVSNNNSHNAVLMGLSGFGGNESYSAKGGFNGTAIRPSPDFTGIAKAMGAYGEKVTQPDKVEGALQRALEAVKSGQSAVLDFVTVKE